MQLIRRGFRFWERLFSDTYVANFLPASPGEASLQAIVLNVIYILQNEYGPAAPESPQERLQGGPT